jgi:hypothetical protein
MALRRISAAGSTTMVDFAVGSLPEPGVQFAVASLLELQMTHHGLVRVIGSAGEVNRGLLGQRLAAALPSVDLAYSDLP